MIRVPELTEKVLMYYFSVYDELPGYIAIFVDPNINGQISWDVENNHLIFDSFSHIVRLLQNQKKCSIEIIQELTPYVLGCNE